MTVEVVTVPCAACGKPITRVRMFWGHVERQYPGTAHYARPATRKAPDRAAGASSVAGTTEPSGQDRRRGR